MEFISLIKDLGNQSGYLNIIKVAFLTFPFLAMLITVPYIISQYRKYGSIHSLRTVIVYSFVLYLLTAYFMVILPLPSLDYVLNLKTPKYQLIPFKFIQDVNSVIHINNFATFWQLFKTKAFLQVLFNIAMTIPFGIYLRYYFKASLTKSIIITFILSLFFEITQLTGLYGIYPRSYRLFDIDDLMLNTLGGIIGYLLEPLISSILPSREKIDEKSYNKGFKIGILRRGIAFLIDLFFIYLLITFLPFGKMLNYCFSVILYFIGISIINKGKTFGKMLVSIKVVDGIKDCKWYQYVIRYFILYIILLPLPIYINNLLINLNTLPINLLIMTILEILFLSILWLIFVIEIIFTIFDGDKEIIYDRIAHTKIVSSIKIESN